MRLKMMLVGLIAGTALLSGCDSSVLLAPTESTIALSSSATAIPAGGTTTLTAVVIEPAGTPVQNGTVVRFSTNLGRVEPVEAQTRNGVATATFMGESAGLARITATSGPAGATDSGNVIEIAVGAAAVENVALQASPSAVSARGGSTTITANVLGANNQPLRGIPVTFSTSAGTLSATTATTDANGQASVQLTTNRAATVTARAGAEADDVEITIAATAAVTLAATPENPFVGQPVTLTVTPTEGTAPSVVINWGDGSSTSLGVVSTARTTVHSYSAGGTFTITATATDNGESVETSRGITVGGTPSASISVTPTSLTGTTSTNFVFTITPNTTNGVANVSVDFGDGTSAVDLGAITSATQTSHRFSTTGTFTVRVTQTDSNGGTSTSAVAITVN